MAASPAPRWSPAAFELAKQLVRVQPRTVLHPGFTRFNEILSTRQQAVVDDQSPQIAMCTGRRSGKTTTFIAKVGQKFDAYRAARCAYFAPSDKQGVAIIWEDIREYNRMFDLGLDEHWSDKQWSREGATLEVIGFNSRRDSERARGRKFHLVCCDEVQGAPEWFAAFIVDVVAPTTLDFRGQIVVAGTPSPTASGFFYDAYHAREGWSNGYHWTCAENPYFINQGRDPLREARERYSLAEDSITYRREWLGEWIVDPDALVYYIPPGAIRAVPANQQWHYNVTGLDLGWRDNDAIAVVGVDLQRQWCHLRHIEAKSQQTNHQLFARLKELQAVFPGPVVFDPAGHATTKTIETFRGDAPQIIWEQAEKSRKVEFIQTLNDDLRSSRAFVETDSLIIKEATRLRWKRPGQLAEDADHTDIGDAWLYASRRARDLLRELPKEEDRSRETPYDRFQRAQKEKAKATGMVSSAGQRMGKMAGGAGGWT